MPKTAETYAIQLQILKDRGLVVPDDSFALHCLEHHNYYRLSAYRFPFTEQGDLIRIIEPSSHWPLKLKEHILTLDPQLIPDMGFPEGWAELPIWQEGARP